MILRKIRVAALIACSAAPVTIDDLRYPAAQRVTKGSCSETARWGRSGPESCKRSLNVGRTGAALAGNAPSPIP